MAEPVLGSLTMDDLSALRKLSKPDAELFLSRHQLSESDKATADKLVGRDKPSGSLENDVQVHDPMRGLWMISAWLAGASWRQLARYHKVAPQTIMAIADRRLISVERQAQRIRSTMSLEALDAYHKSFIKHRKVFDLMLPQQVAMWLLDNTELDNER